MDHPANRSSEGPSTTFTSSWIRDQSNVLESLRSLGFPQLPGFSSSIHASQTHGQEAASVSIRGFTLSTTAVEQSVYFNLTDMV